MACRPSSGKASMSGCAMTVASPNVLDFRWDNNLLSVGQPWIVPQTTQLTHGMNDLPTEVNRNHLWRHHLFMFVGLTQKTELSPLVLDSWLCRCLVFHGPNRECPTGEASGALSATGGSLSRISDHQQASSMNRSIPAAELRCGPC